MIYDVTAHHLLSPEARRVPPKELEQLVGVAEDLLGLAGSAYGGEDEERAARAVALQVNHLVALGSDAFVFSSVSRGGRSWSFRGGTGGGDAGPALVHPIAAAIVAALPPSGENPGNAAWAPVRSRRRGA